ncbi:MAG TPA: hypothetical protein VFT89_11800 [Rhizobiaceae bacterium]|nr:hypothetical protein [Rhizobiaceae bacterium]
MMNTTKNNPTRSTVKAPHPSNTDLAADKMGRNNLQGDDQDNVRNQRRTQPDTKQEPDELMESFTKLDKEERARKDLGKGNRSSGS